MGATCAAIQAMIFFSGFRAFPAQILTALEHTFSLLQYSYNKNKSSVPFQNKKAREKKYLWTHVHTVIATDFNT